MVYDAAHPPCYRDPYVSMLNMMLYCVIPVQSLGVRCDTQVACVTSPRRGKPDHPQGEASSARTCASPKRHESGSYHLYRFSVKTGPDFMQPCKPRLASHQILGDSCRLPWAMCTSSPGSVAYRTAARALRQHCITKVTSMRTTAAKQEEGWSREGL